MNPRYEYKTATSSYSAGLDDEVNLLLNKGWILFGDPYSATSGNSQDMNCWIYQALVREIPIDEPVNNK